MLKDREYKEYKNIFYICNHDSNSEVNFVSDITSAINQEKDNNEKSLDNFNSMNNYPFNIFKDKIASFDFDEINNEELYLINKYLSSDKKNESIESTDSKPKSTQELLISKKRKNNNKSKRKKEHSKFEKDNVMKKLNIHFISFIVKYVNFNIKNFISKKHPLFANLSYNFKKKLNNSTFNELKTMTIGEVLKKEGSNKNKRNIVYQKDDNEILFNSIYQTDLKDLLDINYIDFFRQVYTRSTEHNISVLFQKYKAPKNIQFFDDFIKSEVEKDKIYGELYKERLKYISKSEFISDGYPFFETKIFVKNKKKND